MTNRLWISADTDSPVTRVPPDKVVVPELTLYQGAAAPGAVDVFRTYETVIGVILNAIWRRTTRFVIQLSIDGVPAGRTARYRAWPAAHFEPQERPTLLVFEDGEGSDRRRRSGVLYVTPDVIITTITTLSPVKVRDPTGTLPVAVEIPLGRERTITANVAAPADPELELFVLSAHERPGELSFDGYLNSYLEAIERDLAEGEFEEPERFRSAFEEAYEPLLTGRDAIFTELVPRELVVEPGAAQEVTVSLHPETGRGSAMLMIGARDIESGAITMSEPLPLSWDEEAETEFRPSLEHEAGSSYEEHEGGEAEPA